MLSGKTRSIHSSGGQLSGEEEKNREKRVFEPPGPDRIIGHYLHTWCPFVRLYKKHATMLIVANKNKLQLYMGPGGSLNSADLFFFSRRVKSLAKVLFRISLWQTEWLRGEKKRKMGEEKIAEILCSFGKKKLWCFGVFFGFFSDDGFFMFFLNLFVVFAIAFLFKVYSWFSKKHNLKTMKRLWKNYEKTTKNHQLPENHQKTNFCQKSTNFQLIFHPLFAAKFDVCY